jgi:hypothetical protein
MPEIAALFREYVESQKGEEDEGCGHVDGATGVITRCYPPTCYEVRSHEGWRKYGIEKCLECPRKSKTGITSATNQTGSDTSTGSGGHEEDVTETGGILTEGEESETEGDLTPPSSSRYGEGGDGDRTPTGGTGDPYDLDLFEDDDGSYYCGLHHQRVPFGHECNECV